MHPDTGPGTALQQMLVLDSEFLEIPIVDIRKYLDGRLTHATCVTLSQLCHVTRVNDTVIIMSGACHMQLDIVYMMGRQFVMNN